MKVLRVGIALTLIGSGYPHAYLYIHGYQHIPVVGPGFLVQAAVCFALAVLIAVGGPLWLCWLAAAASAGSVLAFALSRTVGLFGFSERGFTPAPYALISVVAELLTVVLCAVMVTGARRHAAR